MGSIGVGDVVTVKQCEHFHWVLYNLFVATKRIAVAIRKNRIVRTDLKYNTDGVNTNYMDLQLQFN